MRIINNINNINNINKICIKLIFYYTIINIIYLDKMTKLQRRANGTNKPVSKKFSDTGSENLFEEDVFDNFFDKESYVEFASKCKYTQIINPFLHDIIYLVYEQCRFADYWDEDKKCNLYDVLVWFKIEQFKTLKNAKEYYKSLKERSSNDSEYIIVTQMTPIVPNTEEFKLCKKNFTLTCGNILLAQDKKKKKINDFIGNTNKPYYIILHKDSNELSMVKKIGALFSTEEPKTTEWTMTGPLFSNKSNAVKYEKTLHGENLIILVNKGIYKLNGQQVEINPTKNAGFFTFRHIMIMDSSKKPCFTSLKQYGVKKTNIQMFSLSEFGFYVNPHLNENGTVSATVYMCGNPKSSNDIKRKNNGWLYNIDKEFYWDTQNTYVIISNNIILGKSIKTNNETDVMFFVEIQFKIGGPKLETLELSNLLDKKSWWLKNIILPK